MISKEALTSGSGGGRTVRIDDEQSDPFSGGSGGKTGSEILAEGGAPESVATIDSSASSVEEKMREDGAQATVETFKNLAEDANDTPETGRFDHVNNTEQGAKDLKDTAKSFVETAKKANEPVTNGPENVPTSGVPTAVTAAGNATAVGGAGGPNGPDGLLAALIGFVQSLLAPLFGGH